MSRDDGDLGDAFPPLSFRAMAERTRRRERNPEDASYKNAVSGNFNDNKNSHVIPNPVNEPAFSSAGE